MITLRFVTGTGRVSQMIRTQGGICMPFCPSHVEALSPDGKSYLGQHIDGGMEARPVGYDAKTMLHEKLVELPVSAPEEKAFYSFLQSKLGQPYDWKSLVSFAAPDINLHEFNHMICSAIMVAGLRACGYFPMPLTVPFHHISPRDLLLILSSHVQIDH